MADRWVGAPAPPLGDILLLFICPLRSPPGPGMTPAGCNGIEFIGGPGGGMEPFELRTVNGEAFGPKPIRPFSLRQSGVTGVNGVNEEDEEDEADEFDERIIFGSITTS